MGFTTSKYESDGGDIFFIRLSDETVPLAGTPPAGDASTRLFVKISKTNREFGIRPRYALYSQTVTAGTRDFKIYKRVPKLTEAALNASPAQVTIGGDDYNLAVLVDEDY